MSSAFTDTAVTSVVAVSLQTAQPGGVEDWFRENHKRKCILALGMLLCLAVKPRTLYPSHRKSVWRVSPTT